jgi:hypothetical protein
MYFICSVPFFTPLCMAKEEYDQHFFSQFAYLKNNKCARIPICLFLETRCLILFVQFYCFSSVQLHLVVTAISYNPVIILYIQCNLIKNKSNHIIKFNF